MCLERLASSSGLIPTQVDETHDYSTGGASWGVIGRGWYRTGALEIGRGVFGDRTGRPFQYLVMFLNIDVDADRLLVLIPLPIAPTTGLAAEQRDFLVAAVLPDLRARGTPILALLGDRVETLAHLI